MNIEDLWSWAEAQATERNCSLWELLSIIDLGPPADDWTDYWCTPVNADPFAVTGMDGAHYATFDADDGSTPVALVAPDASDWPCLIVGGTLHEFLCLGCYHGYGLITGLPHQAQYITQSLQALPRDQDEREIKLLSSLRDAFDLRPWTNIGKRLDELQQLYADELDLPDN